MTKFLTSLCACFCLAQPVLAWNAEGHMVVAQMAYNHLDPAVKAKCNALIAVSLPGYSNTSTTNFVTAAVWADDFKSSLGTGTSHYIDLIFSLDGTPTNGVTLDPFDVVQAIRQNIATLQDPSSVLSSQAMALRYLLHFVGDIQQPLHCSTAVWASKPGGDAGGNGFSLSGGNWTQLHSLWDSGGGHLSDFIARNPFSAAGQTTLNNKVADVEAVYPYSKSVGSIPDPMDWAIEGKGLAQTVSYVGITVGSTPSAAYLNTAQATTRLRMAMGGQRLAKLLNTIFVTNAPSVASATITSDNFGFSWSSVSGRTYRVQWKQELNDAVWNDLTDITASTNSTSFSESMAEKQQQFYRAIVVN
jgi:S1/P1 Nuclease